MNSAQLMRNCLRNILRNRMRSLLTSLGVIIGVGSVIIMMAVGEGAQREIEKRIAALGTNIIQVMPRRRINRTGQSVQFRFASFNKTELEKLQTESSYAAVICGLTQGNYNLVGSMGNASVSVQGVEPEYLLARNWKVDAGVFFEEEALDFRSSLAVLGRTTAKNLFGEAEAALGKQIRINNLYFTVIGLLEARGAGINGADQDDMALVPLDTALTRLSNTGQINSIVISAVSKDYMKAAEQETEIILRESRKIAEGAPSDFDIMNQSDMIDMASATTKILTTLLAAIAGVSLLVGGIGIMNIMLVSVTERTREIGVRMAVGARKRDIMRQFLTESVILSLLGGLIGIGLAFLVCQVLRVFAIPSAINPLIVAGAALFAAAVGIGFGYYPALKAAKLYPIDALRYE